MKTRLSHSAVEEYNSCSYKYFLNRVEKIRSIKGRSALLFGNAIDYGLNSLLLTKDLDQAKLEFRKAWQFGTINNEIVDLSVSDAVIYSKNDHDSDLGLDPWSSLLCKGNLILEAYNRDIIPHIVSVEEIQGQSSIFNADGDEIVTKRDLVAVWSDNKRYLLDNKTASKFYSEDAAETSQQLLLYYYLEKEKLKLDGVGFLVINKNIKKEKQLYCIKCDVTVGNNRIKKCQVCSSPLNTHSVKVWAETQILLNSNVDDSKVEAIIEHFDQTNNGISNQIYEKSPGKSACFKFGKCEYYNLCHGDSMDGLVKVERK